MLEQTKDWSDDFYERWKPIAMGFVNEAERCLQCGKCTGQCPAAAVTPSYNPRKLIRDLVNGNIKRVLSSVELWQCFFCSGCYSTCPMDINFPFFIFMLRLAAMNEGYGWEDVKQLEAYAEKDYLKTGTTVSSFERNPFVVDTIGDIGDIREAAGLPRTRKVSERGVAEINMISDLTGMTSFMKKIGGVELLDCKTCTSEQEKRCKHKPMPSRVGKIKTHLRFYNYGEPGGRIMPRLDKVAQIPKPEQIFFFKSCVASNKYPGIEACGKEALQILGVEPVESDEQTCCGGFVTFANVAAPTASMPAVARNLSLAEEKGLDTCVLCNGCWTFLGEFGHFMNGNQEIKDSINMMMHMMGREYKGTSNVYHIAEMFYRLKDDIAKNVKRPLKGIKIATHYGCHYLGGGKYTAIDDAQMPTYMEELIELMGGTVVPYTANRECCGTGFTQIINGKDLSIEHTQHKLDSVKEADPDLLIVQCPYCHSQLDRVQQQLNYRGLGSADYQTPIIHIAQLVGLALGLELPKLAFAAHISGRERLEKVLDQIGR